MYRLKDSATKVLERGGYMNTLDQGTIYDTKEDAILEVFKKA